jgi:hypothetical protein
LAISLKGARRVVGCTLIDADFAALDRLWHNAFTPSIESADVL